MRPLAPSIRMMTVAAAATTGSASALQPPPRSSRFVYKLGNSLYVPLTSRCNSLTLPQLRGDGFVLPTSVVEALCRVRDAELHNQINANGTEEENADLPWHRDGYGGGDLPPKTRLPSPPFEAVASLPPLGSESRERQPGLDDLVRDIRHEFEYANGNDPAIESIVISGEGEPTLRLEDTIELVRRIKSFANTLVAATTSGQPPPAIRLTTNGLVVPPPKLSASSLPQTLWDCGVSHISVGLMTWNADQYNGLVRPLPLEDEPAGFETMCGFIKDAVGVDGDLEVEATAVDRPDVDKAKTEALAVSLGVTNPVRWRPYFP